MRSHHSEQNQFQRTYGRLTYVLRRDLRNCKPVPKGWFCCVHRSNMTDACWINMRYSVLSSDEAHCVTVIDVKPAGKSLNATCLQCEQPVDTFFQKTWDLILSVRICVSKLNWSTWFCLNPLKASTLPLLLLLALIVAQFHLLTVTHTELQCAAVRSSTGGL